MRINGNLTFNSDGTGYIQNMFVEQFATAPTGVTGRIYYDTTAEAYYYYNGTMWQQFSTGSSAVSSFSAGTTGFTPSSPAFGAVTLSGTLNATHGGTGQSAYTTGDTLYASSSTALS